MKKIIILSIIAVCASHGITAQNYHIQGTATGMDGQKVYIGEMKSRKDAKMIDSTTVANGVFSMENKLPEIKRMNIFIGKTNQAFLLDENPIQATYSVQSKEIKGKTIQVPSIKISGDKDQQLFELMNKTMGQEMYAMLAISFMGKGKDVNAPENKQLADTIGMVYNAAKENTKRVFDSIVDNHPDSYISAIIINDFFAKELPAMEMHKKYIGLSDRVKKSNIGQDLKKTLDGIMAIGVGQIAPDFTLNTPEGKPITLSSLRGKCVLIDFWASWCGPCLREAPNVKKVYDSYRDKGFEVLSVSIDDDKDKWVQAIQKHQLNWLHVSSLKGWKCTVAKLYQVSGVPAMFLIDKDGRIVSTKARGEILEQEVSKLCN